MQACKQHIFKVCATLLVEQEDEETESLNKAITDAVISKFVSNNASSALFVARLVQNQGVEFECAVVPLFADQARMIAFVKNDALLFAEQVTQKDPKLLLRTIQLGDAANPFENVHQFIASTFEPYLGVFAQRKAIKRKNDKTVLPFVMENMQTLKVSLAQCQYSYQIPDIDLSKHTHPDIVELISLNKSIESLSDKLQDAKFLNELGNSIFSCVKDIKKIVDEIAKDVSITDILQELNYWTSMESLLSSLEQHLKSKEIEYTLAILQTARRFQVTTSLKNSGLYEALLKSRDYLSFLKDFPILELLSVSDLSKLKKVVSKCFATLKRPQKYPLYRLFKLCEAVSSVLRQQLEKVIQPLDLLNASYDSCEKHSNECMEIFMMWDAEYKHFEKTVYDIAKKREESIPYEKYSFEHLALKERIEQLYIFRRDHEQLSSVVAKVLPVSFKVEDINAVDLIAAAFDGVRKVASFFDTSEEGKQIWNSALALYNENIDIVESMIAKKLQAKLGSSTTATEMFRVFAQFNALFFKPKIKGAIQAYQTQLIEKVQADIKKLQDQFKENYAMSEIYKLANLRNIPTVSGSVIWARQIEKQLNGYMKKIEDVLGKGWQRMKLLRRSDSRWSFDESLAEFLGVPFAKLKQRVYDNEKLAPFKNDILGTAIALAFLELAYSDMQMEWSTMAQESIYVVEKEMSLLSTTVNPVSLAKDLVKDLGVGGKHVDEGKMREDAENFKQKVKLVIEEQLRRWNDETISKIHTRWGSLFRVKEGYSINGPIFRVEKTRQESLALRVTFHDEISTMIKELQTLKWLKMDMKVKEEIKLAALSAMEVHSPAIALTESINSFSKSMVKLEKNVAPLAASAILGMQHLIEEGFKLAWMYQQQVEKYSRELSESAVSFNERVSGLMLKTSMVETCIEKLKSCAIFNSSELVHNMASIQQLVDELNLASYSNLDGWVQKLNSTVEDILKDRLLESIGLWSTEFRALVTGKPHSADEATESTSLFERLSATPFVLSLKLAKRRVVQVPHLSLARTHWLSFLHKMLSAICNVPRIKSDRYDLSLHTARLATYSYLIFDATVRQTVRQAVQQIEDQIQSAHAYISVWSSYEALWNADMPIFYSKLGNDITQWISVLGELKAMRKKARSTNSAKNVISIDDMDLQAKLAAKFDGFMSDILHKFKDVTKKQMEDFFAMIKGERSLFENMRVESSVYDAIEFLSAQQRVRKNLAIWSTSVDNFIQSENLLRKNRVNISEQGWVYAENVSSEWSSFKEVFGRRSAALDDIRSSLVKQVLEEESKQNGLVSEFALFWKREKPVHGTEKPEKAMEVLKLAETNMISLTSAVLRLNKAKEALDITVTDYEQLKVANEEIGNLKRVWSDVKNFWDQLLALRSIGWTDLSVPQIKSTLDSVLESTSNMPAWMSQYAAIEQVVEFVKMRLKDLIVIKELKTDAVKDRHWKELKRLLNTEFTTASLTLGTLFDIGVQQNELTIREVLRTAQGEYGLEMFLAQVKEIWNTLQLSFANYNNKCFLIRNWDDVFNQVADHLKSLSSMRASPFFKVFDEDCTQWENKLNKVRIAFDCWLDVQRVWVYLEGVFTNPDIQNQLPKETAKFKSVNAEFIGLMKKVQKNPYLLEAVAIPNIQQSLEKLQDVLAKIQKALGVYLEKQRNAFPRFYFVGDEDLLEIIGSSNDVDKIQKHLKKMFAGIHSVRCEADTITAILSRDNEIVELKRPITIDKKRSVDEWLRALEREMKSSLSDYALDAVQNLFQVYENFASASYLKNIFSLPAQISILASQIVFTKLVERALQQKSSLDELENMVSTILQTLAEAVISEQNVLARKKYEHLITEIVHHRDMLRSLKTNNVQSENDFSWLYFMRFYLDTSTTNATDRITIRVANASFPYGFEYLGLCDRLVQTPLTDRCFLTLTQALNSKLGGSPFGPAGTGKTESVKMLGTQFGRLVLVFCCDESFDFKAMGRIFVGLCQCGAWGCFDEFNRLEEKMLSAVSQQIQTIQVALRDDITSIELIGRQVPVHQNTGVFVTMNPGYAGRSNLPDNLKLLFRNFAMIKPDKDMIAQVTLFSQGFQTAEDLARKVVLFFDLCSDELSKQSHYDFGLRALKTVLANAGHIKREYILQNSVESEAAIIMQSVSETMTPKLVGDDTHIMRNMLRDIFFGTNIPESPLESLRQAISQVCKSHGLVESEEWVMKIIQFFQIQSLQHGVMLVGPSGCGKTRCWKTLLNALFITQHIQGNSYVIDAKAMTKDQLYGSLDPITREWNDGIFTSILRKIIDNSRGESNHRHWIVFDGDVDPEWVENLNSVLDDNKLFTLPNGERLALPSNVRILFEVEHLKFATLATVSRCGMIWFSETCVTVDMITTHYLENRKSTPVTTPKTWDIPEEKLMKMQIDLVSTLNRYIGSNSFMHQALQYSAKLEHVMPYTTNRLVSTLFSFMDRLLCSIIEYNVSHVDFPMEGDHLEKYFSKSVIYAILWSFGSSLTMKSRREFAEYIVSASGVSFDKASLMDYEVQIEDGDWSPLQAKVADVTVESHQVTSAYVVIPTIDTVRHEALLLNWIISGKSAILCGPAGCGKTMILSSVLKSLPDYDVIYLNFSSATQPELLLKSFEQYCTVSNTQHGYVMHPTQAGRHLVVFCDEINLPATDKYGTQRVITLIRQLIEHKGYWRAADLAFVKMERIIFVGACNPPSDPGRVPLSERFLRHCPVLYVDFPEEQSLKQIYSTLCKALLKTVPHLKTFAEAATNVMVEYFTASQTQFNTESQPHYIYSPRDLSRWIRALHEGVTSIDDISLEDFVKLLVHEGLRIFGDKLVHEQEREWSDQTIDRLSLQHFPSISKEVLSRPLLFSIWMHKHYVSVEREKLRQFVQARMRVFEEEELEVKLVMFDSVLEHILRIDRVLRQPLGHLLLVGVSGAGKTILSRFVAWMNGYSVFTIKAHRNYSLKDFEEDLRTVLKRAGCKREKICFIFDEANVLQPSFLEYMNSLLASGEVPGLFDGEEYSNLIALCKAAISSINNLNIDSNEEVYQWFVTEVQRNLHIVFTTNPSNDDFKTRSATSPALFNRCVIDWFGNWPESALFQVAAEYTRDVFTSANDDKESIVNCLVSIHKSVTQQNVQLSKKQSIKYQTTPRHFLDLIHHFKKLNAEKFADLQDQQLHISKGLQALIDTESQVTKMQEELSVKQTELTTKDKLSNEKLQLIVTEQQVAEAKKKEAQTLSIQIEARTKEIEEQKTIAEKDLSMVQPQLDQAKLAVKQIKREFLNELKVLNNPTFPIQKTLETIICMLNTDINPKSLQWQDIKRLMGADFISKILAFDSSSVTKKTRKYVQDSLADPSLSYETVNHASRACGPMIKWMSSQISFAEIVDKVQPLRDKAAKLEAETKESKDKLMELKQTVSQMEQIITSYTDEYKLLVRDIELIKQEMQKVQEKVARSTKLLSNLSSETERWKEQSVNFKTQINTLVGDTLLGASFLTYAGTYDEYVRRTLMDKWIRFMEENKIVFKSDISLVDYLCKPDDRLNWQSNKLPNDDLCIENAVVLSRFNRYPMIVDPTGQANEFLLSHLKTKNITKTSFLDSSFLKNLESALRFGTPLLIQDAEKVDPIINPILNKEVKKVGGRNLIRVGNQDVDFSPTFQLFMSTRDASYQFDADIQSRVTFVNFCVTPSSLKSQCSYMVLQKERPDINEKRSEQLKLQGEYKFKLRKLEDSLLNALSNSKGALLENESVISTLESLKQSASEIIIKAKQSEEMMVEMSKVVDAYNPLAVFCSKLYFLLEQMSQMHFMYHYALSFFFEILHVVLHSSVDSSTTPESRIQYLTKELFREVYIRVGRSLLQEDKLAFALRLALLYVQYSKHEIDEHELDFLLKGRSAITLDVDWDSVFPVSLSSSQRKMVSEICSIDGFSNLPQHAETNKPEWKLFLQAEQAELHVPLCWDNDKNILPTQRAFRKIMLTNIFRPDSTIASMNQFIYCVFGEDMVLDIDMSLLPITKEVSSSTPILLASTPGHDASDKVDQLTAETNKKCVSIAMGTPESYTEADVAINMANKSGSWVMLKNVQLSSAYLVHLEKKLHSMKMENNTHPEFRLFLTAEISNKLPSNLLKRAYKTIFEPAAGVKASMMQLFKNSKQVDKPPVERARLHLLATWMHSVIVERLRFRPLGWSKLYEFNQSDLKWSLNTIDKWVDSVAKERTNIAPEMLPWQAIHSIIGDSIYGGKIDNEFDMQIMHSFLQKMLNANAYSNSYVIFPSSKADTILSPKGTSFAHFADWIKQSQETFNPEYLALPYNVKLLNLSNQATRTIHKVLLITNTQDDQLAYEEEALAPTNQVILSNLPSWAKTIQIQSEQWLSQLPTQLFLASSLNNLKVAENPLLRCLKRELAAAASLLKGIRTDLTSLIGVCTGVQKLGNHHRTLADSITKGMIPGQWKLYPVLSTMTIHVWMADLIKRFQQHSSIADIIVGNDSNVLEHLSIWLGGLIYPEAYLSGTRQYMAQVMKQPLEFLSLCMAPMTSTSLSFEVQGLTVQCASLTQNNSSVEETENLNTNLGKTKLEWRIVKENAVKLPIYLNEQKTNYLGGIHLALAENTTSVDLYAKGACLYVWHL